jgi:phosphatidylserine decarboxylase
MKIHREGNRPLQIAAGLLLVNLLGLRLFPRRGWLGLVGMSLLVFGALAQFFRDPIRTAPQCGERCVLSPADGTVVAIERVHEGEFFHDNRIKISIFMSVINVHVNRVPVNGKLIYYRYHPGQYLMAFHPKSSELNERNTIVIEQEGGQQVLMRQIAGTLARRICFYLKQGQTIAAGQELGFIRFGSRCDIFLPLDAQVNVALEDKVIGGETIIASL